MNIEALPSRYWEQKAREARNKTMLGAKARRLMHDVARRYRQMATIASKRDAERASPVSPATALPGN